MNIFSRLPIVSCAGVYTICAAAGGASASAATPAAPAARAYEVRSRCRDSGSSTAFRDGAADRRMQEWPRNAGAIILRAQGRVNRWVERGRLNLKSLSFRSAVLSREESALVRPTADSSPAKNAGSE